MAKILSKIKGMFAPLLMINRYLLLSFILLFFFTSGITIIYLARHYTANVVKSELLRFQTSLNEMGWDIAYEDLSISSIWPLDVFKAKDFQIYKLSETPSIAIKFPDLRINPSFYNSDKVKISMSENIMLSNSKKTYEIELPHQYLVVKYNKDSGIKEILGEFTNINIKDFASIEEIKLGSQRMSPVGLNQKSPFFENHFLVKNIVFSSKQDLILTDTIEKIYINANVIGQLKNAPSYRESMYDWLSIGGYLDIKTFVLNWRPLLMVGKGNLYFNEKLEPGLRLNTSSKALVPTLNVLEEKNYLERKGTFVAKILLSNKSFKLSPNDEYSTVVTPIQYKDHKLSVENITVKNF